MTVIDEARQRATTLLAGTQLFDALGITELGADSRMLAHVTLEPSPIELQARTERAARDPVQLGDACVEILASHAAEAMQ